MPSKSKAETETITTTSQNYQLKLFLREIKKPEETSNYDYPDNVPNENNREHIKNSKYPNVSFKGIPEKNQLI